MDLHPYYKDVITYKTKLDACTTDGERESVNYYLKSYEDVFKKQLKEAKASLHE